MLRRRLFITAQVAVPSLATVYVWLHGGTTNWGWQMFSR